MQKQARRSNQIAQQYRMAGKDSALDTIQPNPAADEQIPGQDVAPLLTDKIGVAHHPEHRGLWISAGVEHVVEFCHRRRPARFHYGGDDDEEVYETKRGDYVEVAEQPLGYAGVGQKDQEQPKGLRQERGDAERRLDGIGRGTNRSSRIGR